MEKLFEILDAIDSQANDGDEGKLTALRQAAREQYDRLPLPNPREKGWSKLSALEFPEKKFHLAGKPVIKSHSESGDEDEKEICGRIVINEGEIEYWLDEKIANSGVILTDLESAMKKHEPLVEAGLRKITQSNQDKLAEFTAGNSRHGFLLYIPEDVNLDLPIEIDTILKDEAVVMPVTALIFLESKAKAALIIKQASASPDGKVAISALNQLVQVDEGAELHVLEIQKYGNAVWNFVNEKYFVGRDAAFEYLLWDQGSAVVQRKLETTLAKDGSSADITGVYTPRSDQVFVYDTQQNHLASHSTSNMLFGGVLDGSASSLWKGNVLVASGTKGVDGFQRNQNLLLNEKVHAEAIPGLEIITDDVKCSHAVTISSVDPEQLFFLRSRGIDEKEGEELIVSGFLESAMARIRDERLKKRVQKELI